MRVIVGSKWESQDKRDKGRIVEVVEARGSTAVVQSLSTGRRVAISIARLLSPRWKPVVSAPVPAADAPGIPEAKASGDA